MVLVGVILAILGGLGTAAAVAVSKGGGEILGVELNTLTIFLLGMAAGLAIWWGLELMKAGTKRSLQQRKERKEMAELSDKLSKAEADRQREAQGD
jgi:protein-S-isoprenylcysteine O-methyltransferase Ste14